jgi:hypothetical protein
MASRRPNPTRQIEIRQRGEDHVAKYNSVAAEHSRLKMQSTWEHATDKKIHGNRLTRAMNTVQARHDDVLVARRARLAEKLKDERALHETMLENLSVTDDQRRDQLMQRARDLRVQRETLRKQDSEHRKDQLFRDQSVLVREAESRIKVLHVADERRAQGNEKARKAAEEAEEERFFYEQLQEQQRLQAQRAQADLQKLHTRAARVRGDLDMQVTHNKERKAEGVSAERQVDAVYGASIVKGLADDAAADAGRRQRQRDIADETRKGNDAQLVVKKEEELKVSAAERAELEALLAKITEDEVRDREKKKGAREESVRQMQFVEQQMNAVAESETALDRQWQEENDRQWGKRQATWDQDQKKREATLYDVFKTRKGQVEEIRGMEATAAEATKQATLHRHSEASNLFLGDVNGAEKRRAAGLANEAFLKTQMAEKHALKATEGAAKRSELTGAQAVELQYQTKIRGELDKLDHARPATYAHVKLQSSKRGLSDM